MQQGAKYLLTLFFTFGLTVTKQRAEFQANFGSIKIYEGAKYYYSQVLVMQ